MTTRSGRRAATAEAPHLSHIEALLIAQGAWEMGTGSSTWPAIAKILSKHPLVTRPKSFFTAQVLTGIF
jgi:bromodomain-containing protein 8